MGCASCRVIVTSLLAVGALVLPARPAIREDAERYIPLNDLGMGTYRGFSGGLYPEGRNVEPEDHAVIGLQRARSIQPLDPEGRPDPNGAYVLLSIGMSNTAQEFCSPRGDRSCAPWSFMGQAAADPSVRKTALRIVNGAMGGRSAAYWDEPTDPDYDRIRDTLLAPHGLSEKQVQIAWVKVANPRPTISLPSAQADAYRLVAQLGNIIRSLAIRYPNIRLVFLSSRIYAGYVTTPLNPEPYAYESGFAVKWVIQAQIEQMRSGFIHPLAGDLNYNTVAPWIGWGPYLWADGTNPRSDGLTWEREDFQEDGTHPSPSGQYKVGSLLLKFFKTSPYTKCWFLEEGTCP